LELAQSGKFNSQIHVDFMWDISQSQEFYDSEDDLDERVNNTQPLSLLALTKKPFIAFLGRTLERFSSAISSTNEKRAIKRN